MFLTILSASLTPLSTVNQRDSGGFICLSEPTPIFTVNVTISYDNMVEKLMLADHTSNLEDGNWISLSGSFAITLPPTILIYEGVSSATYVRNDRTIEIEAAFDSKEVSYPLTAHPVYYPGDTVKATFYGSTQLAGEEVDIRLIETSPLGARDVLNEAFKGNIEPLKTLIESPVWSLSNIQLDFKGDCTFTFTVDEPGDYVLLVLKEETGVNTYTLKLCSATAVEVLDYKIEVSAPSSVRRGRPIDITVNLLEAPNSATGYRYGALIIHESSYRAIVRLETNGTVPGTVLTGNRVVLLNGTAERAHVELIIGKTVG